MGCTCLRVSIPGLTDCSKEFHSRFKLTDMVGKLIQLKFSCSHLRHTLKSPEVSLLLLFVHQQVIHTLHLCLPRFVYIDRFNLDSPSELFFMGCF